MWRLIRAKGNHRVGDRVRIKGRNDLFFVIVSIDGDEYTLENEDGQTITVNRDDVLGDNEFEVGDRVVYKTHPYDTSVYTVREILGDGTYFIENNEGGYTGVNGRNLELV